MVGWMDRWMVHLPQSSGCYVYSIAVLFFSLLSTKFITHLFAQGTCWFMDGWPDRCRDGWMNRRMDWSISCSIHLIGCFVCAIECGFVCLCWHCLRKWETNPHFESWISLKWFTLYSFMSQKNKCGSIWQVVICAFSHATWGRAQLVFCSAALAWKELIQFSKFFYAKMCLQWALRVVSLDSWENTWNLYTSSVSCVQTNFWAVLTQSALQFYPVT